jgi:hypothetical protein
MMCVLKFKRVDKRDGRINRCGAASAAIEMFCDTFLEAVRRTAVGNTRFQSQYVKPGRHDVGPVDAPLARSLHSLARGLVDSSPRWRKPRHKASR